MFFLLISANSFAGQLPMAVLMLLLDSSEVEQKQSPMADFSVNASAGFSPLNVNFDANGSMDADGSIVSYAWDFGDGSFGSGLTTSHSYIAIGTFIAKLTVTDDDGISSSKTVDIIVNNRAPVGDIAASSLSGAISLDVQFDASNSTDADGTITSYAWDFGDGAHGQGVTANHRYTDVGIYTVNLTITDNHGASQTQSETVYATAQPNSKLVAHWPLDKQTAILDEGEGAIVADDVIGDADGIAYGASYTTGRFNRALSFDGNDDYVEVAENNALALSDFSLSTWVYLKAPLKPAGTTIIEHDRFGAGWYGLSISPNNKFNFRWSPTYSAYFGETLMAGQWYHITASYQAGSAKMYINGQLLKTISNTSGPVKTTKKLRFGSNLANGEFIHAKLDDIRVYNYGLTDQQVSILASDAPEVDTDEDGLSDLSEAGVFLTDPNKTDTDDDGVDDKVEVELGMNPLLSGDDFTDISSADKHRLHVMNRLTFGPTSALDAEIKTLGVNAWIADQLMPENIPEKGSFTKAENPAQYHMDNLYIGHLYQTETMAGIRPMESKKHLQALMGVFWDNHFSTYQDSHRRGPRELYEADTFYENALGNFGDLLEKSAKSYTMSIYLNGNKNIKGAPNENYAREVMELHTLGLDGGYNATDIAELARIFTGWTYSNQGRLSRYKIYYLGERLPAHEVILDFAFQSSKHDNGTEDFDGDGQPDGNKTFLGHTIVSQAGENGVLEGEEALTILAEHPSTANFICTKLAMRFISDVPAQATIDACKSTFLAEIQSADQIAKVLLTLFSSAEFNALSAQRNKSKDIQEYLIGLGRLLDWEGLRGNVEIRSIQPCGWQRTVGCHVERAGQGFYKQPPPTGWPEDSEEWIDTGNVLNLMKHSNEMLDGWYATNLVDYFAQRGLSSAGDVMSYVFYMMLGGEYDAIDINLAYDILRPGHAAFDVSDSGAEEKLRFLLAQFAIMPKYHLQ